MKRLKPLDVFLVEVLGLLCVNRGKDFLHILVKKFLTGANPHYVVHIAGAELLFDLRILLKLGER